MAAALLDEEVPCRDTDPLPSKDLDSNRDSPVAFTINFGFGDEDPDSAKEKAKKLERFALRSSLRKPKSPRTVQSPPSSESSQTCAKPKLGDSRGKTLVREKSNLSFRSYRTKSANPTTIAESNTTANCHNQQQSVINNPSTTSNRELSVKSAHRKESSSSRHSSSHDHQTSSTRDQHHHMTSSRDQNHQMSSRDQHHQMTSSRDQHHQMSSSSGDRTPPFAVESRRNPPLAESRRRLTTTLSPEESKMISHFEKEIEAHSLEIVERSYEDDEFEVETESSPSETGTYTVGREEKERRKKESCEEIARFELENLVGDNQTRSNYVQDWASRHAAHHHAAVERGASAPSLRPTLIPSPRGGGDCSPISSPPPTAAAQMLGGTSSSLSKSRRRLPATPGGVASSTGVSGVLSPDSTEFSPSTDSPSPTQESDEGETNFMKHTQHLVDVMEARINQKTGPSMSSRTIKSSTIIKKKATTSLSSGDTGVNLDPREAWERRKNYDPLIASGRKKEPVPGRKSSSASMGRSTREEVQLSTTNRYQERGSAKSASSDSSGYFSRGEGSRGRGEGSRQALSRGDGGRYSMRGNPHKLKAITRPSGGAAVGIKQTANKPQSKLMAADKQTSRSSSCLTSKEAEFQAWKRRKNYDPLKSANSAANSSSSAGIRSGNNTSSIRASASINKTAATSKAESINNRFSGRTSNGTAAGRSDSIDGGNSPRNAYAPSPTPHHHNGSGASSLQHKRIQEMSQSLVHGRVGGGGPAFSMGATDHQPPMQRSASFHYENMRMRSSTGEDQLRMYSLQGTPLHPHTSEEDESTEPDYGSGCDSSNADGGHRHYYLDEDELILPIYPSGYNAGSNRSIYNRSLSPKPSPSRSRSRLEALDNLVISTIYSVSSKLCNNTQSILKRAGLTFPPADEDQATTLETVLYLLEDVDLPSSPAKKTSRELSGTLRNLKKCEQALEVLHKLIESDQDD